MADNFRIDVDWSEVERGARQLGDGLENASERVGRDTAASTAATLRSRVPHRTGRLAATVRAVPLTNGAAVTYGGSLPYAAYIERRTHAVADTIDDAPRRFYRDLVDAAEREVNRL